MSYQPGTIIDLPTRGRQAEPIPDAEIKPVLDNLDKLQVGQGITNGRTFDTENKAQSYGKKLIEALTAMDTQYDGKLGISAIPDHKDKDGKRVGPFVVAVRLR